MAGERWKSGSGLRIAMRENARAISEISADGGIAVVVFEAVDNALGLAETLGWDGVAPVFRLDDMRRTLFAAAEIHPVTTEWLSRETTTPRVLLLSRGNSLLLNQDENGRWSSEPGSEVV